MNEVKFRLTILVLAVLLLIILIVYIFFTRVLIVKKVSCTSEFSLLCTQIEQALIGENYFEIDELQITERLIELNPEITLATIRKNLNGNLSVDVSLREALAAVITNKGTYLIDDQVILYKQITGTAGLPVIYAQSLVDPVLSVSNLSTGLTSSIKALEAFKASGIDLESIKDLDSFISVQLREGIIIWLPYEVNLHSTTYEQLVTGVSKILARASYENKQINKIDMRYSKVVVE